LNHNHTFFFITSSLQNKVVSMWFFNGKKLFMRSIDVNNHGELGFTNLALKLLKIVMLSSTNNFFFNFEVNPLSKAIQVNSSTRTHANTWIKQKVFIVFTFFKANLTLRFLFTFSNWFFFKRIVFHNISAGINSGFVFSSGSAYFTINACFTDKELNSTQFDNLSRFKLVAQVFSIFLFKFADDKISLLFSFIIT